MSLDTLAGPAQFVREIRKSRFLAQAGAIEDVAGALAFVDTLGDRLATHNCWAWRLGQNYRFHDDGEPAGTAGRPILQAIDGQRFDRVVVLVTRWYGGIKLGAGGLARAYGGSAAECLRLAGRVPIIERSMARVRCEFGVLALLQSRLVEHDAEVLDTHFDGNGAELHLRMPRTALAAVENLVRDLTRGRGSLEADECGPAP